MTEGENVLSMNGRVPMTPPVMATARQPYLFISAPTMGPVKQYR